MKLEKRSDCWPPVIHIDGGYVVPKERHNKSRPPNGSRHRNDDMPKYYFNIITVNGRVVDPEGTDLPGMKEAYISAIEDARALMSEAILEGKDISSRQVEICDSERRPLRVVLFREAISVTD